MKKLVYSVYAVVCYFIFFAAFLYLIGFVENANNFSGAALFGRLFPKTLDGGTANLSIFPSILTDIFLIALFGLQHSVMARPEFKKKWVRFVPRPIERSTYVLCASLILVILYSAWQPVNVAVWDLSRSVTGNIFFCISFAGWGMLLISTFLINHFDLFGLRQVYLFTRNREFRHVTFKTPFFYRIVRHPLYLSFLIAFWFTPVMTFGHLVFSAGMSTYILIGIHHEEKDLERFYGEPYRQYRLEVPKIIPFVKTGKRKLLEGSILKSVKR